MRAIETKRTNRLMGKRSGWNGGKGIPVHDAADRRGMFCYWRVSWLERLAILIGFPIRVRVMTELPITLDVGAG